MLQLICFVSFSILPIAAEATEFGMSVELLVQSGMSFYDQGRLQEALQQFKKALIIDPHSTVAREFFTQIQKEAYGGVKEKVANLIPKSVALKEALDDAEQGTQLQKAPALRPQEKTKIQAPQQRAQESIQEAAPQPLAIAPEKTVMLDEAQRQNTNLELNKKSALLIQGTGIKRFLNTTPQLFTIERKDKDSLIITGTEIGNGVFHVWDENGRWTFNLKIGQTALYKALKAEYEKRATEAILSSPFRISYSWDKGSFHSGRRIDDTGRQSLSINQSVSVRGETPYGNYDASFSIDRLNKEYDIVNLSTGLMDAHFWGLEHLNIRVLDFGTGIAAFKFPNVDLRGARIDAPMFNRKVSYTAFWGGIPPGTFTRLEPGLLDKTVDAYLYGISLFYDHSDSAKYKVFFAESYGSEINKPVLTNRTYGTGVFYKIGNFNFDTEAAYDDRKSVAYTSGARLRIQKTNMSLKFTENPGNFASPLGGSPSGGSSTITTTLHHSFDQDVSMSHSVSATRDRNKDLVNPNNPDRPSYTFDHSLNWRLDPFTDLALSYLRSDTKGSISPALTETQQLSLNKRIFFIKPVNTYLTFSNSTNKNFTGATSNFDRQGVRAGMSFNVFKDLTLSVNQTNNFIKNRVTDADASPSVLESSLSYYSRIFRSPFYGRLRVSYRDEEETEQDISFLSGEDRLEFQAGFDYRPSSFVSAYLSLRAANIWAEQEGSAKRFDADIRYGVSLAWDTGFRWNTKGNACGFVFYDIDADGIRDKDEEGVEGVTVQATSDKSAATNKKGYYVLRGIIGKKANVEIDMNTVPRGYILTTPSFYSFDISHMSTKRLDFGIATRSDIIGYIFVDVDGNNKFDRGDKPIGGAVIILDETQKAITDDGGQYQLRKLSPGKHSLEIDLKTIPTSYIPKVALKTEIELKKGETFFYNIPLRTAFKEIE